MQISTIIIAVLLFVAFTIGVNLGLHGALEGTHTQVGKKDLSSVNGENSNLTNDLSPDKANLPEATKSNDRVNAKTVRPTPLPTESPVKDQLVSAKLLTAYQQAQDATSTKNGPIISYLKSGKKFPIVILTCNRPELLEQTIQSLLATTGIDSSRIMASQDGQLSSVGDIIKKHGFHLVQSNPTLKLRGAVQDGGIAKHYKFSLSSAFDHYQDAPAIIVVEDDLLFSPDFYEYMHEVGQILDVDKSTFAVSAWNDNGFKSKVQDPLALRRTEYLPGLGWLLSRELYKNELEFIWPNEHWDHWLRSHSIHKGREIVYPQMPRTYHNGIKGTFMNLETHNRYFRDISNNHDPAVTWMAPIESNEMSGDKSSIPQYIQVQEVAYESRVTELISQCTHVRAISELISAKGTLCVWIDISPDPPMGGGPAEFEPIAQFFGIWHEHRRGAHHGMHEFPWRETTTSSSPSAEHRDYEAYVLVLNIFDDMHKGIRIPNYKSLMPADAVIHDPRRFDKRILVEMQRQKFKLSGTPAPRPGMNCDEVCREVGKSCKQELLEMLNTCQAMMESFPCKKCESSMGPEQPAYVDLQAQSQFDPGKCLVNMKPQTTTCTASHPATLRLCACS